MSEEGGAGASKGGGGAAIEGGPGIEASMSREELGCAGRSSRGDGGLGADVCILEEGKNEDEKEKLPRRRRKKNAHTDGRRGEMLGAPTLPVAAGRCPITNFGAGFAAFIVRSPVKKAADDVHATCTCVGAAAG